MNTTPLPIERTIRDFGYEEMMKLFEDISFRERIARTLRGIGSPRNSGDYKFARLQLQLLTGPVLAIFLPLILICILLSIETKPKTQPIGQPVDLVITRDPPVLIDPEPINDPIKDSPKTPVDFEDPAIAFQPPIDISTTTPGPTSEKLIASPVIRTISILKLPTQLGPRPGPDGEGDFSPPPGSDWTREGENTVLKALRWLKSKQNLDGSWPGQPTAMTGLALLTFLAHGETTDSKFVEFGPTVEKGIKFLLANQSENGLFKSKDGNNYAHPIATYALCEAYTLTQVPMVKVAAEKALVHLIRGQHPSGGWDYNMKQTDRDDTSYMGWCAQAIKAAHIAGDLQVEGLEACYQNSVRGFSKNAHDKGGFGYTGKDRGGLSGVGVLCMQLMGAASEPEVSKTLAFLDDCTYSFENWERQPYRGSSPVYYWYYITQAKFHSGGERWKHWNRQFNPELIKRQVVLSKAAEAPDGTFKDIGYWDSPSKSEHNQAGGTSAIAIKYEKGVKTEGATTEGARIQDTCLSALQLMVYYRYLPTYKTLDLADASLTLSTEKDIEISITR